MVKRFCGVAALVLCGIACCPTTGSPAAVPVTALHAAPPVKACADVHRPMQDSNAARIRDLAILLSDEFRADLEFDEARAAVEQLGFLAEIPGARSAVVLKVDDGQMREFASWGGPPRCAPSDGPGLDAELQVERHEDIVCASAPIRSPQRLLGRLFLELAPADGVPRQP